MKMGGICEWFFENLLVLVDIGSEVLRAVLVPSGFLIIAIYGRGEDREKYLSNLHTRPEDDGDRAHVRELEGDMQKVSRIDETRSIVDDQSEPRKWWLPREVCEILMTAELFDTRAENRHSWPQDKSLFCCHCYLFICRKDLPHWVNIGNRMRLHDEELVSETDIIARGLESLGIESCDTDITWLHPSTDVTIGEIHNNEQCILYNQQFYCIYFFDISTPFI